MADEKSVSEKLDAFFDSFNKRMDAADEERKSDRARLDAVCSRMDAADEEKKADKAKKDAEVMAADKARKDAAEKEEKEKEEKAKADAARKDAEEKEEKAKADAAARAIANPELAARLAAIERQMATVPDDQRTQFVEAQSKAERVAQAFGDSAGAPRWLNGESVPEYRRRLLGKYKQHSTTWKDVDLSKISDDAVLDVAETKIYADAMSAARHPTDIPLGTLTMRARRDETGREIREFYGDPEATWAPFKAPVRAVSGWKTKFN